MATARRAAATALAVATVTVLLIPVGVHLLSLQVQTALQLGNRNGVRGGDARDATLSSIGNGEIIH